MSHRTFTFMSSLSIAGLALIGLGACSGGGAGDGNYIEAEESLVLPLVGTWTVRGNFNGQENDLALLIIDAPGAEGEATARFYDDHNDSDPAENCVELLESDATVSEALDGRIFMDGNAWLDSAILTLDPNSDTLEISFYDSRDVNNNGDSAETLTVAATRESLGTQLELGECAA